jgi:hypothetical protein
MVTLPLYLLGFAILILGVALGGIAAWFNQGKWRRHRRRLEAELGRVRAEFDRAKRDTSRDVALREMRGAPPPQQGRAGQIAGKLTPGLPDVHSFTSGVAGAPRQSARIICHRGLAFGNSPR